jgi:hypothetical protein
MKVYRVEAACNDSQSLVPALDLKQLDRNDPRLTTCPAVADDWTPPPLVHYAGKRKLDPDFWDYDQGQAFAVSDRVAQSLAGEAWCKLIPFTAETFDPKLRPVGMLSRVLLATTLLVDAIDRAQTRFKPYGDEVLDFDQPGAIVFRKEALPASGLFLQRSGASFGIFCAEHEECSEGSFVAVCAREGWTGLRFRQV